MLGGFAIAGRDRRDHGEVPPRRQLPRPVLALAAADGRRRGLRLLGVEQHRRQLADRPPHHDHRAARRLRRDPRPARSPCRWPFTQAYRRDRPFDRVASVASFVVVSLPAIVIAVLLKLLFVEHWHLFPRDRRAGLPLGRPRGARPQLLASGASTLALPAAAVLTPAAARRPRRCRCRATSSSLAKAKGVSPRRIMWRHALPNSLFTLLSSVGVQIGVIVGGAVVVETFFDLDGMGSLLVVAVIGSDLFTVQAIVALLVVAVVDRRTSLIDLLYGGDRSPHRAHGELSCGRERGPADCRLGALVRALGFLARARPAGVARHVPLLPGSSPSSTSSPRLDDEVAEPATRLGPGRDGLVRHGRPRQRHLRQESSTAPARRSSSAWWRRSSARPRRRSRHRRRLPPRCTDRIAGVDHRRAAVAPGGRAGDRDDRQARHLQGVRRAGSVGSTGAGRSR